MEHRGQKGRISLCRGLLIVMFSLVVGGCATAPKEFVFDSPNHRLTNGFRLLELGRIQDARREFKEALKLDSACCAAYRGIGLSFAMEERFQEAFRAMGQAKACAQKDVDKALAEVGLMRVATLQKGKNWIGTVERYFERALDQDPDSFEAYYYLGAAYAQAKMFQKALWAFKQAVKIGGPFCDKAGKQLAMVKKVLAGNPDTALGEDMALKAALTRADVAALFVRELRLYDIYLREMPQLLRRGKEKLSIPQDTRRHAFKREILRVLEIGIQGLSLLPDGSFAPDGPVTRAEFATMLAHIMRNLHYRRLDQCDTNEAENPFEDVSAEAPYFADVIICTRCGHIMEPERGLFEPMDLISGPDALLAIRKLKRGLGYD